MTGDSSTPAPEPSFDDAEAVRRLLDTELSADRLWDAVERADILEHQLAAPLAVDVQLLGSAAALRAAELCESVQPPIRSFRDLFGHPAPPWELLMIVARLAHHELTAAEPVLERNIARLFYFLAIGVARTRCSRDLVTEMTTAEIREALRSLAAAQWVDPLTAEALRACASRLSPGA